jgi:hypothetical protein
LIENTIEGRIFQRLLDKIDTIKEEMGERVFDVLGLLLTEVRIDDLVMEAVGKDSHWVEDRISTVEERIDDVKRMILEDIENKSLIKDELDMGTVNRVLGTSNEYRLTAAEIERFVRLFLNQYDGKLEPDEDKKGIFRVELPSILKKDSRITKSLYVMGQERTSRGWKDFRRCKSITFSKGISKENEDVRFVALGHPLISRIIQICAEPDFRGRATIKYCPDLQNRGGAFFVFRSKIIDLRGNVRGEKLICLIWDKQENYFREIDPVAVWGLENGGTVSQAKRVMRGPESFNKVHNQAMSVVTKLTEDLLEETKAKVEKETRIKIEDIKDYRRKGKKLLEQRIARAERRAKLLEFYSQDEQKRLKQTIGRYKATIRRLTETTDEELKLLKAESELVYEAPGCLAIAILVPRKVSGKHAKREGVAIEKKMEVEKAGIARVMEYEREHSREPIDVSLMFKGYDITSEGEDEKRFIEVKSFKDTGPLEITSHEWMVSQRLGRDYWLYVVENALSSEKYKISKICDPSVVFANIAERRPFLQFKILIESWKDLLQQTETETAQPRS